MKLTKGMNRDTNPSELGEGYWVRGKNKVMSRTLDAVMDEWGFKPFGNYPGDLKPIGNIKLANGSFVVFSLAGALSEIGILHGDGSYERKLRDDLGFRKDCPITGTYHYGFNNRLIIAFRSAGNVPRILNLDKMPFALDVTKGLVDKAKMNLIDLFPDARVPEVKVREVSDTGGNLPSAVYYVALAYEIEKGDRTNYLTISNPISVTVSSNALPVNEYVGSDPDKVTSKALHLTFQKLDTRFQYVQVVLISKINGLIKAEEINRIRITGETMQTTISGTEVGVPLLNEEVLVKRVSFNRIGAFTNLEGTLYGARIQLKPSLDFQPYANQIQVKWVYDDVIKLKEVSGSYRDAKVILDKRMFMPFEVYALFARLIMTDGSDGGAFHIPGRLPQAISEAWNTINIQEDSPVFGLSSYDSSLDEDDYLGSDVRYFQTRDTAKSNGTMGYWENADELYPDDVREDGSRVFPTGKVRHHRFPSISKLTSWGKEYLYKDEQGVLKTRALGMEITLPVLPLSVQEKIQHIEICYARRTSDNTSIYGYAQPLGDDWAHARTADVGKYVKDWLRLHSFDLLLDKPAVSPTHLHHEFHKVGTANILLDGEQSSLSYTDIVNYQTVQKNSETYDYVTNVGFPIVRLSGSRYLANNVMDAEGGFENRYGEEAFMVKLNTSFAMDKNELERSLVAICGYKPNVYSSFFEQQLINTGTSIPSNETTAVAYGGDTFISTTDIRATNLVEVEGQTPLAREFSTITYLPTVHNANLRHAGLNWYETYFSKAKKELVYLHPDYEVYPDLPGAEGGDLLGKIVRETFEYSSYFAYNKDYTSVNELNTSFIYDAAEEELERPFLIVRAGKAKAEDRLLSWRVFLPNDYYESVKNRGEIVNLQAYGSTLLIHHRHDLLRTVEKLGIDTSEGVATLGSGDIFRMAPEAIIKTDEGYAGTQHQLSCILTKIGYLFVDALHGKVFLLSGELNEISNRGLFDFFKSNLPFTEHQDNPYFDNGITVGYDEHFNRFLVTKKEVRLPDPSKYKGEYTADPAFISSLQVGDVILKDGKYQTIV